MKGILLILVSVTLGGFGQLLLKKGMMGFEQFSGATIWAQLFRVLLDPWNVGGILLYLVSGILWLAVLSEFEVNFALPWHALTYIIILFGSWIAFGENLNAWRFIGTILICLGVIAIARSR